MSVSSDAELMLKMADNAVLIVRQDWTDVRATNDASDTIRQTGVDFTGFILNAFFQRKFVEFVSGALLLRLQQKR